MFEVQSNRRLCGNESHTSNSCLSVILKAEIQTRNSFLSVILKAEIQTRHSCRSVILKAEIQTLKNTKLDLNNSFKFEKDLII